MNRTLQIALAAAGLAFATQAAAQVVFYENDRFEGRSFTTGQSVVNFNQSGFNDRASSVVILQDRWEVCEDARFGGRCVVLRPGRYPSLAAMGLNDRVSSVRNVSRNANIDDNRYAPAPIPAYDNRRRQNERLFEAQVTSVRAVVGTPQQRCWVDREHVDSHRNDVNVPGAVVGALIGGVLGHQIGSGRGNDAATAGGAIGGAYLGANVGRDDRGKASYTRDVRRCTETQRHSRADYWDVGYHFRGRDHQVQMSSPPGATVTVNRNGEPRA